MRGGKRWNRNQFLILSNIKKSLPAELWISKPHDSVVLHAGEPWNDKRLPLARQLARVFLNPQLCFRDFFYWI